MKKRILKNMEWWIVIWGIALSIIGLIALFSATSESNYNEFTKQIIWMIVGIVGLGLIGGSAAKAFKAAGHSVYAFDINRQIVGYAGLEGTVDAELSSENIGACSLLLLTATPLAVVEYIKENACHVAKDTLVIDFCGTKRGVCENGFALAAEHGFTYVGGHPMAGLQYSGYKYSKATLFNGASFIMVPPVLFLSL